MKTLASLTITNLKQNRARTIMTIVGVALSVALILACIGFFTSVSYSQRQDAILRFGDYHVMYRNVPGDVVSVIEKHELFDVKFYSEPVDCTMTEYGFRDCWGLSPISVNDYTPITDSSELVRDSEHKYNVFAYYKNPSEYTFARDRLAGALRDAGYSDIQFIENNMISEQDGAVPELSGILKFWVGFIFIGSMSIIAAFVIRNSFNISITERVRQFGMLASIGARPKQIRRMVYNEALIIGAIAIPLGLLLGCAATGVVVSIVNALVGFSEATDMLFFIPLNIFAIVILTGLFIIFLSAASPAIVASRVSPIAALRNVQDIKVKAKKLRTSKLTQKMWGIGGVIAAKNLKRSRSKYRTTVISIVISVAGFVGMSSFMMYGHKIIDMVNIDTGANVSVSASHIEIYDDIIQHFNIQKYAIYYDIPQLADDDVLSQRTEGTSDIKVVSRDEFERYARSSGILFDFDKAVILQDTNKGEDAHGNYVVGRLTDYKVGDEIAFKALISRYDENAKVPCDPEILFEDQNPGELSEEDLEQLEKCKNGEIDIHGDWVNKESEMQHIKITAITDENPIGIPSYATPRGGYIFISEDHALAKSLKEYQRLNLLYIADSGLGEQITKYVKDEGTIPRYEKQLGTKEVSINVEDYEEFMKNSRNTILLFEILIYGFIAVAALIGVTNIFNTITTNVALRAKEFAVLKSVGMTESEFNRMIRLESLLYSTRALLIGLPIGVLMSYGVSKLFTGAALQFGWLIPWESMLISVFAVAILVSLIMHYSVRKIKKQNIIETIREESF